MAARLGFIPPRLSPSRSSLLALKNGFVFSVTDTSSPVRGLRPMWALRRLILTPQLDALAASQSGGDLVEYRRDDQLDVRDAQIRIADGGFRDEFCPGQRRLPLWRR